MAYFRPGNLIPDHIPLAALNGRYRQYEREIPRPLFQDRPEDAPDLADTPPEKSAWYIFRHAGVPGDDEQEGLALWGPGPELPVLTEAQVWDLADDNAWEEIPGYRESTDLEKRMVRGLVCLWLFEMKQAGRAAPAD